MTLWTEAESSACVLIWQRGASFSIIGRELGKTRSSVAGRLARLGKFRGATLPLEQLPKYRGGGVPQRKKSDRPVADLPRFATTMHERIAASTVEFDSSRQIATLQDRLPDGCTWPYGEVAPFTYCNQPCVKGLSFCPSHCKVVFAPPRAR